MNIDAIIKNIESGIIPEDKVEVESLINYFRKIDKVSESITSLIVAYSRREFFADDINGWLDWAQEDMNIKSGLHHLRKCGDLLLDMLDEDIASYTRLIKLCRDKLLPISRLERPDVGRFLASRKVEKMSREEIRAAVAECLGEPVPEAGGSAPKTKWQPSLWDAIDIMSGSEADNLDRLYMADEFSPSNCYKTGMVLVDNVINYFDSHNASTNALLTAEQQLRSMADKLGTIRERQSESITKELEAS